MSQNDGLAEHFEAERPRLTAIAYRMLGSPAQADDAVQETWLRLSRTDASRIENLGGWLTTVVARVSLDQLRARASRREDAAESVPDTTVDHRGGDDPEHEALLADSVGAALLVVLETLSPSERVAFVLHDLFAVPFDDIGALLGRSPAAAKQLASRARHKVQGTGPVHDVDPSHQRAVVEAFLVASRGGDVDTLVALLHPDVVLRADAVAVEMGSPAVVRGATEVAGIFSGRALAAQAAEIDGATGVVWMVGGRPKVAWDFTVVDGEVVHIDMLAAPGTLDDLDLVLDADAHRTLPRRVTGSG
jgi:RNA polymerase sigma-70 factor (ECF subfamily)